MEPVQSQVISYLAWHVKGKVSLQKKLKFPLMIKYWNSSEFTLTNTMEIVSYGQKDKNTKEGKNAGN